MITIYETKYLPATDHAGTRIRVTNKRTGKSRIQHWDYSINGGIDQHEYAVREASTDMLGLVQMAGETKHGYLFTAVSA